MSKEPGALQQQVEVGASIHLALEGLQLVDLAFCLPVGPRLAKGSQNGMLVGVQTTGEGTVNLMAAGERLSPIAFVKRPLLLPAIPPWLRCEIGEASGGKSGGAGR